MKKLDEEELRHEYTLRKKTGLDKAKKLDKKAKGPAYAFAYSFGIVGTFLLGLGMCLSMKVVGNGSFTMLVLGIVIGLIGIVMISINYPLYSKILRIRKEKYASQILLALNSKE